MKKLIVLALLLLCSIGFSANEIPTQGGNNNTWGTDLNNYLQKGQGRFDIRAYGGIGNDSNDNATAFTDAIAALPANGGVLFIPEGTFRTNQPVTLGVKDRIVGVNRDVSIIKFTAATGNGVVIPAGTASGGVSNIKITSTRGSIVSGNALHLTTSAHYGLFSNIRIEGYWTYGIFLDTAIGNRFDNIEINDFAAGTKDKTTGIYITGVSNHNIFNKCAIRNTNSHCIDIIEGNTNVFNACEIGYTGTSANDYGFNISSIAHRTVITDCWIEALDVGVVIASSSKGTILRHNYFVDNTTHYTDNGDETTILWLDPLASNDDRWSSMDKLRVNAIKSSIDTLDNTGTPTIANSYVVVTGGSTTITDFDNGVAGQIIMVLCKEGLTFDFTTAQDANHNLDGSSADISADSGDILQFLNENGTTWHLISNNDASVDNN